MAFLGIGRKKLSTEAIGSKCPSCGSDEMMMVDIYARYFALLWIPVFPLGKEAQVTCPKCGHKPEMHTLPASFFLETEQMKSILSSPGYLFTGSVLILLAAVFIAFRLISGISNTDTNTLESYLNSPEPGDVYEIKTDEGNYSLLKIVDVKGDSVYVRFHNDEIENESDLTSLKNGGGYSRELYAFSLEHMKINYEDGLILNIERGRVEETKTTVTEENGSNKKKEVTPSEAPKRERTKTNRSASSAK